MIDHRRGLEEPDHKHDRRRILDFSDHFVEYDHILVNNDRSFNTNQDAQRQFFPDHENTRPPSPGRHSTEAVSGWNDEKGRWPTFPGPKVNETDEVEFNAPVVDELTEHQLLLLSPHALAYALKHKQWSEPY